MDFLLVLILAVVITAACLLAMAVGVLARGRSFTSCGCASMMFNGERIDCPGHVEPDDDASRCSRTGRRCDNAGTCGG